MKFPAYGHFEYVKKKSEPKFALEDYIFIHQLRINKDLDLDTLFELAYNFAKKHQQQLYANSGRATSQGPFDSSKRSLQNSYFSAVKDVKENKNYNYSFFDLPPNEAGESVFDGDDEGDQLDLPVLPVSDMDGELYFLEPFSILKPIRILQYSLDRSEENILNYRHWRPINFTTEANQSKGYFYAYDPTTTFSYELRTGFGHPQKLNPFSNSDRLVRTVRYWQFRSMRSMYLPESKSEKDYSASREVRLTMKNTTELEGELEDDEVDEDDEFDTLFNILYNSLESYPSQYLIEFISRQVKNFSSDMIFPDWLSAIIIFNVIFFISDYVSVFLYWYFPFLLNFFYEDLASFSKIYYVYSIYIAFMFFFIFYLYVFEFLLTNNLLYKMFNFAFVIFVFSTLSFFFIFPFSIIFYIGFFFFFIPIAFTFVFLQLFTITFYTGPTLFCLYYSTPEAIFGYYKCDFYFSRVPNRFSETIFSESKFFELSVKFKSRVFHFKPTKGSSVTFFNKFKNFELRTPAINAPIYYQNIFSDISFQRALGSRLPPQPHEALLFEDDLEYNNDTPFAPDLTGNRAFYFHSTIDYRIAPENATRGNESHSSYQSLFPIENDFGQFVEDSTTHSQGYWYPSSSIFSPAPLAIYHPYAIIHTSFSPFFHYYQLKIFLNALQIEQLTIQRHKTIFSLFVLKKFYNTGFFLPINAKSFDPTDTFFTVFQPYPVFYWVIFFFNFLINLLFLLFKVVFSALLIFFRTSTFPIKPIELFLFPATSSYRTFLRFYFQIIKKKAPSKIFSNFNQIFRFFFVVYFFSLFFPSTNYYARIRKVSATVLAFFFFFLFDFLVLKCVIHAQIYFLIRLTNFCVFIKLQLQLVICGILESTHLFVC